MLTFPFGQVTDMGGNPNINVVLFHYNPDTGGDDFAFTNNPSSIKPAYGYWVNSSADTTLTVTGDPVTDPTLPFQVKAEWNQFGNPYRDNPIWGNVKVEEVLGQQGTVTCVNEAINEGWFTNLLFKYNPNTTSYDFLFAVSPLDQKLGFWLCSHHDCWLVLT